ncbi:MAG: DNA polymerase IV [Acetanaerobacterium sp.]
MDRVILHADINNCYASIECLHRPELRDKPVVVGGDVEARHGIVLAKNYIAKRYDIKTGEALWQARQKCRDIVVVPPNFPLYLRFSKLAKEIYRDYSSQFESFGIDEGWLDITGSIGLLGSGEEIAEKIRQRIKLELGITVSIGVSFNKIFAKLGSDMKKPDAITVITKENFKEKVWPLPVGDLLYVGRATQKKLDGYGISTIGKLATAPEDFLLRRFGKWGGILYNFANGRDTSPVCEYGDESPIKSIGNSTTTPRDLVNEEDAKIVMYVLSESVAARMREQGFKCKTVAINIRDNQLNWYQKQGKVTSPTDLACEIQDKAMALFKEGYQWQNPIRSIGVRGTDFVGNESNIQLLLYSDENKREQHKKLEQTIDRLRGRFGVYAIQRGVMLTDPMLSGFNPKDDHVIHPTGYF